MTDPSAGPPADRPTGLGLALAVVAAVIWGFAGVSSIVAAMHGGLGVAGVAAGAITAGLTWLSIGTLVIWAVLFFAFVRPRAPRRGAAHLALIAAAILVTQLLATTLVLGVGRIADERAQSKIALASMRADIAVIASADPEHPPTLDPHPKATGRAGAVEGAVKRYLVNVVSDRAHYIGDIKAEGFDGLLKPHNLGSDPGMKHSRALVERTRALVTRYQALNEQRVEEVKRTIHASGLNAAEQASFDRGLAGHSEYRQVWALEFKIVDECQQLVEGLAHAHGRWLADGDMMRFADGDDLASYNQHIRAIKALAAEEDAMRTNALNHARSSADAGLAGEN
jgi:hypothetical protein